MSTVADIVIESLRDLGVRHVFGVPSGGWVDYLEAIRRTDDIDFVLASHEGGAAFMAEAAGRMTGIPGVCFGTFGPGATNLATGVGDALLDRSPMIALTDEMPDALRGRTVQMQIDHQALFQPLTKKTTRLTSDDVRGSIYRAAAVAMSGRPGPVHIGLPVGLSAQPAADSKQPLPESTLQHAADPGLLAAASAAIDSARRPLIAIGLSAVRSPNCDAILALAEKLACPVVVTPMAKGIVAEDHPSYAGVLFHALSDQVGEIHQQADLVVGIGYDPVEFNYEAWIPDAPLIHVDIVGADIDADTVDLQLDIVGDIDSSVRYLLGQAQSANDWDLDELASHRRRLFERLSSANTEFGPRATLDVLREVLPGDGIMTCDVGAHTHLIGQKWLTPASGKQLMTNGWSAMGYGIPSAIAAKLCNPQLAVCTVVGDGGFLMTCGEIATAVRERLNIVIVVLTDNDLALIRIKQQKKNNPVYGTPIRASGTIGGDNIFGAPVYQADNEEDFADALQKAFAEPGPVIVEALISSAEYDDLVLKKDRP